LAFSTDLSKKGWDKDTLMFKPGPPVQKYFFAISFNDGFSSEFGHPTDFAALEVEQATGMSAQVSSHTSFRSTSGS
jgi:hypothetical protein